MKADSLSKNATIFTSLLILLLILQPLSATATASPPRIVSFQKGFTQLFGGNTNLLRFDDDNTVHLHLNEYTGAGFRSSDLYNHGLFSAKIKLPSEYTAGVVVAFYTSNGDVFEKTHDELDFEFLGNIKGKPWRFQTNLYGNGSTSRGREERYTLWFDPSKAYHRYTILWTSSKIIFYIDDVPIREVLRSEEMGSDFPSKPMALYATIWDASNWATNGGKYKVNYKYAPFVTEMTDLVLHGCVSDPIQQLVAENCVEMDKQLETIHYNNITPKQRGAMKRFREKYMYYSYCYDTLRYPVPPPECVIDQSIRQRFKETGRPKFLRRHHRHSKKAGHVFSSQVYEIQDED
ncbi:probable xyloglucan endotransglucosylase/hydrolase protein 30 [Rutidosis leptorrhynchoides]|uniref:probable xyloglucan endotransglucosylase/hydrolase protein 30 n=1 Tax=Rutidosis leptorrhynchoides TaxID=125765 RepID=UPI003A991EBA